MHYLSEFEVELDKVLQELKEVLIQKNKAYGDAALNPVRIFSKADAVEQIKVRLDDKISRLSRGKEAGEDVYLDLMGYLILLRIAQTRKQALYKQES
jgi:hypothetical protein